MSRPVPNPGILDIAPYTPGKSPVAEPGRKVFKLSANETPFGPSPKAIEAFKHVADHLEDYPEGTSRVLREAIGRSFGLDPNRIVCGAGPGSFTSLRIAGSIAKGIAGGANRPLYAVPSMALMVGGLTATTGLDPHARLSSHALRPQPRAGRVRARARRAHRRPRCRAHRRRP